MFVEQLPIPMISEAEQVEYIKLVDEILLAKNSRKDSSILEEKIDNLVFGLYGLSEEEIRFIEDA